MTYHLYAQPDGTPDVSTYPLNLELFPGYRYLGEFTEKPDVSGKRYQDGQWVRSAAEPEYVEQRRREYPPIGDQLDALWRILAPLAQDPKAVAVLDQIATIKARYPKP